MKKIIFSDKSIVILIIINLLVITVAFKPDFLLSLETLNYDFSVNKSQAHQNSTTQKRIAIITIDKKSMQQLGQWPWDSSFIADMLDKLSIAKARSIGLQIPLFNKKNVSNLDNFNKLKSYIENTKGLKRKQAKKLKTLLHQTEKELDVDGQLAKSISNAPNVILTMIPQTSSLSTHNTTAAVINKNRIKGKKSKKAVESIISVPFFLFPYERFAKTAAGIGYNKNIYDHDGNIRRQPLILRNNNNYFSSFSLLLAARSQGIPISSIRITEYGVKLGKRKIKTNSEKIFLPSNIPATSFNHYSFYDVLTGNVSITKFKNKIVIIGLSDATSLSPATTANVVTSLIDQNYFSKPNWTYTVESSIFILILIYLFLVIPHFRPITTALISLFFAILLFGASQYFLLVEHIWLQTTTAIFVLLTAHLLYYLYHRISSEKREFIAESAQSIRMLVNALQAQGQTDMAMDKLRNIPEIDDSVLELAYGIAQDYESKRKYGKAISVYDYILSHNKKFRDTAKRKERAESIDGAVLLHSNSIITNVIDTMPKLGHYEIEKEIGRGAMGVVYLGNDSKIDRTVAIKTLALSEEFGGDDLKNITKRFFKEAKVAGKLNHPNIVTVYDAGQEHDLTWMAMEYLDGHDLTYYTQGKAKPKIDWVLNIIWHVAGALGYAHEAGIVHRDVKPANIMYSEKDDTVKIMDFGIARVADSSTTKTGTALGTPSYMSPEQISGEKVKGSSDFFSLGVTMYELLTGELPFRGDSLPAMIYQITTKRHPSITSLRKRLPTCVKTIVDKLLQKDPKKRYPDGASLQEAIERCMKR